MCRAERSRSPQLEPWYDLAFDRSQSRGYGPWSSGPCLSVGVEVRGTPDEVVASCRRALVPGMALD
jgi:hypothetical protein